MPITDHYQRLPLASITVDRSSRQRREIEVDDLADSIRRLGVMNPIIITRDLKLVAGERRLEASRKLNLPDIPVRYVEELSHIELAEIELEENIKRKDLKWQDEVASVARLHQIYQETRGPDWTQEDTAGQIGVTAGYVSQYLKVARDLTDTRISGAGSTREALNIISRREQRQEGDQLQELLDVIQIEASPEGLPVVNTNFQTLSTDKYITVTDPQPALPGFQLDSILCEDFLKWAPLYEGRKFNLIHCDFPYGIELFASKQGRGAEPASATGQLGYRDSRDIYEALLECLCLNLDRLMSASGHLMFWYSGKHETLTRQMFQKLAPSLAFTTYPLIWLKSDNAGIAGDYLHEPRHVYETALLASRSKRQIIQIVADGYSAPTDKTLHPSCKPEPMLRHFFRMLVDEGTSLLDPTCGSGSSLRAAESLGAKRTLGLEIDPENVERAKMALRKFRTLQQIEKKV